MRVVFERGERRRYWSQVHRDDGVVLLLPGFDRKWRVPHDLAHVAVERELRLIDGVIGSIAAGAIFDNMTVVEGRLRHDAKRRSAEILRRNRHGIGVGEALSGVVHHAVEHRDRATLLTNARKAWGVTHTEPLPYGPAELRQAADALDALARQWEKVPPGGGLSVDWLSHRGPSAARRAPRPTGRR